MTETCGNKTLKSQDIRHSWCFFKKEEPIQCSAKTPSQSFYDAFTAFLSSSCAVDLEENNVNESLCPNAELRKPELEDDKINLIRQSAANTGCNEEKLGRVDHRLENCASAEKFVANIGLTGDRSSSENKCGEPAVSLSVADSNMSRDWSACKAYKNEYPRTLNSGTGLRNLRSRDGYNKCSQNEGRSSASRSAFYSRSAIRVNCQEELSCDGKNSFSSPYQQVQRLSSAGTFSRPYNSESQFLRPRNFKLANNVNNESVNAECQLQYKEEYRRKLRSAHDAGERRAVSELCHTESAQHSRLATLRRRNSLSTNGHVVGYNCFSAYRTQKAGCRPVFVLLEKMSKKKIEQLQNEMKMCANVGDDTKMSSIRKTDRLKSAHDSARNYGCMNTSASAQMEVSKISKFSRTDENEDDSNCSKTEEVSCTLHSTRIGTNLEASQFCSDGTDISIVKTVKLANTNLNADSSQIRENSDIGSSQSGISQICEKEPLLCLQQVSKEVLNVENTTQCLETSGSNHVPEFIEIISGSVSKHEKTFKPEIKKTCSSRTNEKSGFDQSLHETNNSGCLHTVLKAVDQHDFKAESDVSKICNSSGTVNATECGELSQVLGIHPPSFAVISDATRLIKKLPETFAKSDILQDTIMSKAVDILVHPSADGSKVVSQTLDRAEVMTAAQNTFNPSLSEPMKMKSRGKLVESKPAVNLDVQAQCADNSESFPKSSNVDKRKKKRFSNPQNDVLGFNTLGAISDHPKDCLKSTATSFQPTKARKRKAECHVVLQKASDDKNDDADSYVPNFMTHSQSLDESSLTEKWKEATDLEEWWLNDIGNWTNFSALSSAISSCTTSEKSTSSEDFRWCAMLADQSEWPELEIDFPAGFEESVNERSRNVLRTKDLEQGLLHGEGAKSSEFDVTRCEDSQLLETHVSMDKLKCVKHTTCRVGKRKQVQWLKLKETGSLSTRKLTTAARKEIQATNSELNDTFLRTGLSDNVTVASGAMELREDEKKRDQVNQIMTTSITLSEKENADNAAPSSPAIVGTLSVTSAANSTRTSSVSSVILAPSDVHMSREALFPCSPCVDTFSHTASVTASCHTRSEAQCSHTSSVISHSASYLNLKCNAAVGPISHNHSSSTVAPFCQNHFDSHFDSNSAVASFSQNFCGSRFDFNPLVTPFNDEPSFAYIVPRSHAASKSCFSQNASAALYTHTSSDKVSSMSSCEQLSRCHTISSEVKMNCTTKSQDSSHRETKAKVIATDRALGPLTFSETTHLNSVKHVIPVTCSTMDSSSLASDSDITTSKIIDPGLNLGSSSFTFQTEDDYSVKTEQSMVNNEGYQKPNLVYNDFKNSQRFQTSNKAEVCEKDLAVDKNIWDHSFPGSLAKSKCESPVLRIGRHMHGRSPERGEICSKDSQPCFSYAGLYRRFSKLDQGLSSDSCEALDVVSENSSQDFPSEVSSEACTKGGGPPSPSSEDAPMYNDCNSDMCSWLAASMGLYTCDCGAAFSDSWSCQQHQSRCSAVIRT